jgi:hypothetical protein
MKSFDRDDTNGSVGKPYLTNYFGLEVEVLIRFPVCSLVRYESREFIVLSDDLQSIPLGCRSAAA